MKSNMLVKQLYRAHFLSYFMPATKIKLAFPVLFTFLTLISCKSETTIMEPDMIITPPVEHYVISSPIEGQLVEDGEPLANAKIIRKLEWNGDQEGTKEDVAITDKDGFFSFDVYELDMAMRGLEQFVAHSYLYLIQDNQDDELLWYTPKQSLGLFSELGSMPKNLVCDLKAKEIATQKNSTARGRILTICRWDNMPEFVETHDI